MKLKRATHDGPPPLSDVYEPRRYFGVSDGKYRVRIYYYSGSDDVSTGWMRMKGFEHNAAWSLGVDSQGHYRSDWKFLPPEMQAEVHEATFPSRQAAINAAWHAFWRDEYWRQAADEAGVPY